MLACNVHRVGRQHRHYAGAGDTWAAGSGPYGPDPGFRLPVAGRRHSRGLRFEACFDDSGFGRRAGLFV